MRASNTPLSYYSEAIDILTLWMRPGDDSKPKIKPIVVAPRDHNHNIKINLCLTATKLTESAPGANIGSLDPACEHLSFIRRSNPDQHAETRMTMTTTRLIVVLYIDTEVYEPVAVYLSSCPVLVTVSLAVADSHRCSRTTHLALLAEPPAPRRESQLDYARQTVP